MIGWIVLYSALAALFWGVFIAVDETRQARGVTFFMAVIWPVTVLAGIGYAFMKSGDKK